MKNATIALAVVAGVLVILTLLATWSGCRAYRRWGGGGGEAFSSGEEPMLVQYFRMDGCPHCERFDSVWSQLKAVGGSANVEFQQFEAGSPEADKYGVRAFPHIQMVVDGAAKVYEGNRSKEAIEKFIASKGSS